jgi:lauroyl/myristoyl acyltransferase
VNDLRARLFAPALRGLDRILPASVLFAALYPVAWGRAILHGLTKGGPPEAWPACLDRPPGNRSGRWYRLPVYLNRFFEVLPDRLPTAKWRDRCRFIGLDHVQDAIRAGQPVILAFAHFGPFGQLRSWLRAAGLPAAMMVGGKARTRSQLLRLKDRWALFPEVPPSYYQDQMSAAIRHLHSGGILAMAMDVDTGRQVNLPVRPGWVFRMPTGPVRLARQHQAALVPCAISTPGPWRFQVEMGAPIPSETLQAGDPEACADLLARMLPLLTPYPLQWTPQLSNRFQKADDCNPKEG